MTQHDRNGDFDSSKAELFEALGHPMRVRILRVLDGKTMSFSDLKKEIGVDSSGHLQFHLGKLAGLIKTDEFGNYKLTSEGQEALRIADVALRTEESFKTKGKSISRPFVTAIVAVSIIWAIIVIASSVILEGSAEQTISVVLSIGFIACLLSLAAIGRRS